VLTEAALLAAAEEQTGLVDLGADSWREALDRLLSSLHAEGGLSELGEQITAAQLQGHLAARLWVTDWHRRHPEIGQAAVPPPIVIVGQPRTGTTILFDLMAQDPQFRVPLTWEVAQPNPPPETATYDDDPRIAEADAAAAMTELLIPGFQAIHPSGGLRGQECVSITAGDFRSLLYSTVFHVPTYSRWLIYDADMAPAYAYHRRFLQLLQWHHPGSRWLLKSPAHQWWLGALFAEYPDAVVVHTHRDPLKVIASTASLTAHLQRLARDETSIAEEAPEWARYLVTGNDRSVDGREDGTVPPGRAVDVQFCDVMADPFGTMAAVYEQLGLPFTPDAEGRMRAFLADNPADKHGVHHYRFSETGLDEGEMRRRTARYEEYFDVPQETLD
jgi:hypothetical protein